MSTVIQMYKYRFPYTRLDYSRTSYSQMSVNNISSVSACLDLLLVAFNYCQNQCLLPQQLHACERGPYKHAGMYNILSSRYNTCQLLCSDFFLSITIRLSFFLFGTPL